MHQSGAEERKDEFGLTREGWAMGIDCTSEEWRKRIIQAYPDGDSCAKCHKRNDFFDDCGWFYSTYNGEYVALCEGCGGHPRGER